MTKKINKQDALEYHEQDVIVKYLNNEKLPAVNSRFAWTPDRLKELDKAQKNILYFAENYFFITTLDEGKVKIKPYKAQKRVLKSLEKNRFMCLLASRQVGKALALDTPIPTPNGWTTMGELNDGDTVYDKNGNPTKVQNAWDVMHNRPCYNILFDDGEEIVADEEHLWFTQSRSERSKKIEGTKKTTKEILETLFTSKNTEEPNHRIPKLPFKLTRIVTRPMNHDSTKRVDWKYIKKITPVESVPVRCITVDNPDGMFLCGKNYTLTSNTTMMTIFALWMTCFRDDYRVIVVANKEATAKNILKRIKMAYEYMPNWVKPAIKQWDVKEVVFGNDSSIAITTTTSTAARGDTANCVVGESMVTIKDKNTGVVFSTSMKKLYQTIKNGGEVLPLVIVDD